MATLEKIRKRAVILTIVIGTALFAFIVGDAFKASSSFFNDTTAAKVDNQTIDVQEFNKRYEVVAQQNQSNKQDAAVMQQNMLQQLVSETILNRECDENAIEAGAEEIALAIDNNQQANSWAQKYVQDTQSTTIQRASDLDKVMYSDNRLAQIAPLWEQMKQEIVLQLRAQKLVGVVQACIVANDLDLAEVSEDAANTYEVEIAKKDYASLDNEKYKPTESDIKDAYNQYKGFFKNADKQRAIHFIAISLEPSTTDIVQGQKLVDKAYAVLQGPNGSKDIRNINEFSNYQEAKLKADEIRTLGQQLRDSTVYAWATTTAAGGTKLVADSIANRYVVMKVEKSEVLTDTMKVVYVQVEGDKKQQDKVLAALNEGKDVSKMKGVQVAPEQPMQVQKTEMPDSILAKFEQATEKYVALQSDAKAGAIFVKVNAKTTATFYSMGMAEYEILPSTATTNLAQDKFEEFLRKNKTADDFVKNAAKAGYNAQPAMVSPNTAQLGGNPQFGISGITNSRKAIRWALVEAEVGQVSNIFQDNNEVLLAVAVDAAYDDEYMPLDNEDVKRFCTEIAVGKLKAEAMKKEFEGKGKNVADYAAKFGSKAETTTVSFSAAQVQGINTQGVMGDAGIIGAIAAAKQGETKFYVGKSAVYAFCVKKAEKSAMKLTKEQLKSQWASMWAFDNQGQRFQSVLLGSAKVKNNLVKFM